MEKKIFLLISFVLTLALMSFSQHDSNIYLKGYDGKNIVQYFDSLHNAKKEALSSLKHSYSCYVIFTIDMNSSIGDFEFIEVPEAPLPDVAKKYLKYLFITTNGMWITEKKDTNNANSKELHFSITLLKTTQAIDERIKDLEKSFEFALKELPQQKRLIGEPMTKERIMTFSF